MQNSIVVQGLSKQFSRYHADRPWTFKEAMLRGLHRMKPAERFWGLRDVSFQIAPGRMVGLIGRNGAGKSTLLRLIGGVGRPDRGKVKVQGRIGAMLDLGAGFHPELTGRENIFISGVIAGLTRNEVKKRFDSIVAFAELEQFIDNPLRTYSSGMQMRLGFAIAAHTSPDILLIDEVLAVGDLAFQNKCIERINTFKAEGCTIILVSHDESQIQQLCDEVVWLRSGQIVAHGNTEEVVKQYIAGIMQETRKRTPLDDSEFHALKGSKLRLNENRFGSQEIQITQVQLLDSEGNCAQEINTGDPLRIEIKYKAHQPICAPIFGASITREDALVCYDTSTAATGQSVPTLLDQGKITLHLDRLDLNSGCYYISVGIYESDWAYAYDYHHQVYPLYICQTGFEKGILSTPHQWEVGIYEHLV